MSDRRIAESFTPLDPDIISRSESQDSLSSGGDSDGGPEEPTPAEISLLSASLDARYDFT